MTDDPGGGSGQPRPTGTVAFLFTDIEGSTEAWATDPIAMSAAVARLEELLDEAAVGGRRAVEQGRGTARCWPSPGRAMPRLQRWASRSGAEGSGGDRPSGGRR